MSKEKQQGLAEKTESNFIDNWSSIKKFSDREISKKKLDRIFKLATNAPTAFNLQPYRYVVLNSEESLQKAVDSVPDVNKWIAGAEKIVVLVGYEDIDRNADRVHKEKLDDNKIDEQEEKNLNEMYQDYKNRSDEFLTAWLTRNTMIPVTFLMLACKKHGIGSCPVRGFSQDELSEKLDLGEEERPMLLIPIGYPENGTREWRRDGKDIFELK